MDTSATRFTFQDLFRTSFLQDSLASFSAVDVILTMAISFLLSLFIYAVYKRTFNGVLYSKNFNISLMAMSLVTTLIIMGVTSNIILSLGMVGALSIIRFRTPIKDPIDIVYLFWAISVGIVTGAGLYLLAITGTLVVGIMLVIFSRRTVSDTPYLIVVNCADSASEKALLNSLHGHVKRVGIRSKSVRAGEGIDLTIEVRLKDENTDFINHLAMSHGVNNMVLVSYHGDLAA